MSLSDDVHEIVADHLAVTLNMAGQGTDAHSTEIAAVALAAVLPDGRTIAQALDDGEKDARFLAFMADTQIEAVTEAAVVFARREADR